MVKTIFLSKFILRKVRKVGKLLLVKILRPFLATRDNSYNPIGSGCRVSRYEGEYFLSGDKLDRIYPDNKIDPI